MKMYVVTYETSSLENLIFLQHTLFHHVWSSVCVLFFTEVEMAEEYVRYVYGMEVSLFGIPANRAHPKRDSDNSNNWVNNYFLK